MCLICYTRISLCQKAISAGVMDSDCWPLLRLADTGGSRRSLASYGGCMETVSQVIFTGSRVVTCVPLVVLRGTAGVGCGLPACPPRVSAAEPPLT